MYQSNISSGTSFPQENVNLRRQSYSPFNGNYSVDPRRQTGTEMDRQSFSYTDAGRRYSEGNPSPFNFQGGMFDGEDRDYRLTIRSSNDTSTLSFDHRHGFRPENKRYRDSSSERFAKRADEEYDYIGPPCPKRFERSPLRASEEERTSLNTNYNNNNYDNYCSPRTLQLSMSYESISDDGDAFRPLTPISSTSSVSSDNLLDSEKDLAADLVDFIVTRGNKVRLSSMENSTFRFKKKIKSKTKEGTMISFLSRFKHVFNISTLSTDDEDGKTDDFVSCTLNLEICENYANSPMYCDGNCKQLHLCRMHIINSCQKRGCMFSHDLDDPHNSIILKKVLAHKVEHDSMMRHLLKNLTPRTCTFYNAKGCNKNSDCPFLHVCKHFVTGECKFGANCKRSHNVYDRQPFDLLGKYELSDHLQGGEEKILQMIAAGEKGKSNFEWKMECRSTGFRPVLYPEDELRLERKYQQYLEAKRAIVTILGQKVKVDFSRMEGLSSGNEMFDLNRFATSENNEAH